jgi:hypothetical protein
VITLDAKTERMVVALNDASLEVTEPTLTARLATLATLAEGLGFTDVALRLSTTRNEFEEKALTYIGARHVIACAAVTLLAGGVR